MRPWVMQAWFSTASCHLGTTRTLRMLKRFYWWIGMSICTRWWLRHCLKCQARKTSRLTVRWPVISMPLPEGPGIAVTPRGNTYILLFTDRFSRRAGMYAVTAAELQPRAWLTPLSTGTSPSGDAHAASARTTASGLLKSFTGGLQASWR